MTTKHPSDLFTEETTSYLTSIVILSVIKDLSWGM